MGSILLFSLISFFTQEYSNTNNKIDLKSAATGDVMISSVSDKNVGDTFNTQVYVDSGSQKVATYGIEITWNESILIVQGGNDGVDAGADGFLNAANVNNTAGNMSVAGFDIFGVGPGNQLHLLTITWNAIAVGESVLAIVVNSLTDETTTDIGTPQGINSHVIITSETSSDGIPGYNSLILFICIFSSIGVIYYFKIKRK